MQAAVRAGGGPGEQSRQHEEQRDRQLGGAGGDTSDDDNNDNNDNNKVGEILNKRADFGIGAVKVQALIVNTLSASY